MFRLDVKGPLQPKSQLTASQLEVPPSHNPEIISSPTEGACSELLDHSSPGAAQLPPRVHFILGREGF